jgi:hypothetical protein
MTAEIINLRKARKARARAEKERRAAENRAKFGRPKSERAKADKIEGLERGRLDAHRRETDDDETAS